MYVRKAVIGYMKKVWFTRNTYVRDDHSVYLIHLHYSYTLLNITLNYIRIYTYLHILICYVIYYIYRLFILKLFKYNIKIIDLIHEKEYQINAYVIQVLH